MTTLTLPTAALRPGQVAAATPARRERYVDFLRVFSLAVVMFGHWLMAAVQWRDGHLVAGNVLEAAPATQWLTWIFQIMPVFFIVGGFSNTASWTAATRDATPYGTWLGSRLARLVRPVLAFAAVWSGVVVGLTVAGIDPAGLRARSIAQPLWFLAVYVVVVAVAPVMVAAQRRWGPAVVLGLAGAVAAVDLARWTFGAPLIGWANLGLVWLFAHQLGVAWRQGTFTPWSRGRLAVLAAAGLGALVVLTQLAGYPHSMVGGVGEARSNMFPPSLAIVSLATWQFAVALLLRPAVDRWLARPRAWAAVVAANGMAMTVFLWHLTALVIVAAATLPTGWMPQPATGSAAWWAWRPVWLLLLAAAVVPLVAAFARVELRRVVPPAPSTGRAVAAALLVAAGMSVLAKTGFVNHGMPFGLPVAGTGLLAVAWGLLRTA
ncbi:MAG TPA: acyltransferase [Acidimicrobiales bacterium]|nr:acyltransferase [Acidimicrobiales bacterium]